MTRTEPSLAGALLDRRYRVEDLIARGGMSSVYRGVDTRLDRPVAVKVMDSRFAGDRSFVDRFEREARAAARLHHPHVVAVHDQGFDTSADPENPRAFLVMELVNGGTLRDLINERGRLDVPLALTVAEQVSSALAAADAAGLVHRDIKPENVLIGRGGDTGGVVKVADFGLVRAAASAGTTSANIILGTVAYLSPNRWRRGRRRTVGHLLDGHPAVRNAHRPGALQRRHGAVGGLPPCQRRRARAEHGGPGDTRGARRPRAARHPPRRRGTSGTRRSLLELRR